MPDTMKNKMSDPGTVHPFEYQKGFKKRSSSTYCVEGEGVNKMYKGSKNLHTPSKVKVFTTDALK